MPGIWNFIQEDHNGKQGQKKRKEAQEGAGKTGAGNQEKITKLNPKY